MPGQYRHRCADIGERILINRWKNAADDGNNKNNYVGVWDDGWMDRWMERWDAVWMEYGN